MVNNMILFIICLCVPIGLMYLIRFLDECFIYNDYWWWGPTYVLLLIINIIISFISVAYIINYIGC